LEMANRYNTNLDTLQQVVLKLLIVILLIVVAPSSTCPLRTLHNNSLAITIITISMYDQTFNFAHIDDKFKFKCCAAGQKCTLQ
jgi:hypothetical protein